MLSVVFTPADSANFAAVEATVLLTVQAKATPVIAWQNPDPITYGTPLSGQQLCASASVPGRFDYSIEPEVKLAAGTHTLAATFTPADTENYAIANATASLEVIKATLHNRLVDAPADDGGHAAQRHSAPRHRIDTGKLRLLSRSRRATFPGHAYAHRNLHAGGIPPTTPARRPACRLR